MSTALITPSFRGDLERCRLLVDSARRHVPASVPHYVVVDRRDLALFQPMADARTRLLCVEDVVPWWLRRVPSWLPYGGKLWLNLRGRPVRNWMLQQIVKLSTNTFADTDQFVFVDSDVFFIRQWDPGTGGAGSPGAPASVLFREEGPALLTDFNTEWHRVAHRLLGLPEPTPAQVQVGYVGNLLSWRSDVLTQLQQRLAEVASKPWASALTGLATLSEYVLYGVFVERVLGFEAARQFGDPVIPCATEWGTTALGAAQLEAFRDTIASHQVAAMISAKSGTDIEAVRRVFLPD